MRISDWSSDVCSSDLVCETVAHRPCPRTHLAHSLGVVRPRTLLPGKPGLLCVVHAERADDWSFATLADQPRSRGVAVVGFLHMHQQARPLHQRTSAIPPDDRKRVVWGTSVSRTGRSRVS